MTVILKISANPRDVGNLWRPRTEEITGGFNPREVLDLQINPNEDDDGLAHNSRNTTEDSESREQRDPERRRERALRELLPGLQHIKVRPEEIGEVLERSPRFEEENKLLESRLGVDLGARGLSFSAGAHLGTVRSDTPYVNYGRGQTSSFGKADYEILGKSMDMFTRTWNVSKAKRRFKGRKYSEDEESEDDAKRSKAKNKRKKKRSGKGKGKKAGGKNKSSKSRSPKRITATVGAAKRRVIDRESRHQKFGHAMSRKFGLGTHTELPLRLRDPIAYARKLANEKHRRATGALPRGMTQHRSATAGVSASQTRGGLIGGDKRSSGRGTQFSPVPQMGTNMGNGAAVDRSHMDRILEGGVGDPLGTEDPLRQQKMLAKSAWPKAQGLSRTELLSLKKKVEALLRQLEKVTKANPELEEEAKRGASANESVASAPQGGTKNEDKPWIFDDTSVMSVIGVVGKR